MSTSKSWKSEERIFAAALGGRRNPNNGRRQADINAGPFAIEHKKTRIMPALLRRAWEQAHEGAATGEIPVVALSHARGSAYSTKRYVMLELDDFAQIWSEHRAAKHDAASLLDQLERDAYESVGDQR